MSPAERERKQLRLLLRWRKFLFRFRAGVSRRSFETNSGVVSRDAMSRSMAGTSAVRHFWV
jgi:hypothetical protein